MARGHRRVNEQQKSILVRNMIKCGSQCKHKSDAEHWDLKPLNDSKLICRSWIRIEKISHNV